MSNVRNIYEEIDTLQKEINEFLLNEHLRAQIKEYFRIGLTYSSNALEGNTLTESETKIVLEEGITIGGKPLRDHLEAVGHSAMPLICSMFWLKALKLPNQILKNSISFADKNSGSEDPILCFITHNARKGASGCLCGTSA